MQKNHGSKIEIYHQKGSAMLTVMMAVGMSAALSWVMLSMNQNSMVGIKRQTNLLELELWRQNELDVFFNDYFFAEGEVCKDKFESLSDEDIQTSVIINKDNFNDNADNADNGNKLKAIFDNIPPPYYLHKTDDQEVWIEKVGFLQIGENQNFGRCDLKLQVKSHVNKVALSHLNIIIPIYCELDENESLKSCSNFDNSNSSPQSGESLWSPTEQATPSHIFRNSKILIGNPGSETYTGEADLNFKQSTNDFPYWNENSSIYKAITFNDDNRALVFNDGFGLYENTNCLNLFFKNEESSSSRFCQQSAFMASQNISITAESQNALAIASDNVDINTRNTLVSGKNISALENKNHLYLFGKDLTSKASYSFAIGENIDIESSHNAIAMGANLKLGENANNSILIGYGDGVLSEGQTQYTFNEPDHFAAVFSGGFTFESHSDGIEGSQAHLLTINSDGNMGIGKDMFTISASDDYPPGYISANPSEQKHPKLFVAGDVQNTAELWHKGKDVEGGYRYLIEQEDENTDWVTLNQHYPESSPTISSVIKYRKKHNVLHLKGEAIANFTLPEGHRFYNKGKINVAKFGSDNFWQVNSHCTIDLSNVATTGVVSVTNNLDDNSNVDFKCSLDGLKFPIDKMTSTADAAAFGE